MTATALFAQTKVAFDGAGALPKGWQSGVTGSGAAIWEVVRTDSPASSLFILKQSGEATFCWAAKTDTRFKDGFVEVKFKPLSGKEDQAGGLVFRFQDANNYYVVRGNALEDNVVLYKTVNGKRSSLPVKGRMFGYGVDAKVPTGRWTTLRVDFAGKLFTASLNGTKLFEVEDGTFTEAGSVGVWTKADSVTLFDDFSYGTK
ncbi:MAG: hypothetical protein HY736_07040 [Verrucomicrobia bacterium]|nr:hypothetical protein [Verrucomicrobiota bacterium]